MPTSEGEIAIYWDLDHPPLIDAAAPGRAADAVASCLALARALGPVSVQRAVGGSYAQTRRLAHCLARRGFECLLALPGLPARPLAGLIECVVQDLALRPGIRRVVVMSTRPALGLLQEFVAGAGRQLLALRGPAARPAALRRVAVRQLATAA